MPSVLEKYFLVFSTVVSCEVAVLAFSCFSQFNTLIDESKKDKIKLMKLQLHDFSETTLASLIVLAARFGLLRV